MTNQKTIIDEKAANFAEEIKQQFEKAGLDAKQQLLNSFSQVLENDVSNLTAIVSKTVAEHNEKMKIQLQNTLTHSIKKQFGGSVFGGILQDIILPSVFQGIASNVDVKNFRASASQGLLDVGKSISRSAERNG